MSADTMHAHTNTRTSIGIDNRTQFNYVFHFNITLVCMRHIQDVTTYDSCYIKFFKLQQNALYGAGQ